MPADLKLCSRQDVINMGFGGDSSAAIQLTKSDPTSWDPALLDTPILMASADVEGAAGNRFNLDYNADPATYPFILRKAAAVRAVYYTWFSYAKGQAQPEYVRQVLEASDAELERLRTAKQGAGRAKPPPRRIYSVTSIDMTDNGAFPRMTLDGFRRI